MKSCLPASLAFAFALPATLFALPERHLFLDPTAIASAEGAVLTVNGPQSSEVVIRPDRPWEQLMISFYTTVIEENGKIRLWYICRDIENKPNLAYAESTDGVTWTKPNLGIVDYHGSRDNNLVGVPSLDGAVFRDPKARLGEEYVYVGHVHGEGVFRYYSPDGLHWKRDAQALLPFRADTQNVVFWDEREGAYALYLRGWTLADRWENRLRKVVRYTAASLASPLSVARSGQGDNPGNKNDLPRIIDEMPTVLAADARDPHGTDVYNISAQLYPPDPRWYVGFPSFFLREKHISDGRLEVDFVGSRDGIHWERYDRQAYVRPGLAGSDNANMVYIGPGLVVRGDELWQYGTGFRGRHGGVEQRKERADGAIYRHVQRLDGFVSLDFAITGGRAVTGPVVASSAKLFVNVDTAGLGTLRVGLRDAAGQPIPGFGVEDCDPIRVNATKAPVSWKGRTAIAGAPGRSVSLELSGDRAKLFGFFFE
jgi:hypothetical protein